MRTLLIAQRSSRREISLSRDRRICRRLTGKGECQRWDLADLYLGRHLRMGSQSLISDYAASDRSRNGIYRAARSPGWEERTKHERFLQLYNRTFDEIEHTDNRKSARKERAAEEEAQDAAWTLEETLDGVQNTQQ